MKKQNIPLSIIFFGILFVAFFVLLFVMFMPMITNMSTYNSDHAEAVAEINNYEYYLDNQETIEAKIETLTEQYNETQENLYIDSKSSIEDLQSIFTELGIKMTSMTRGDSVQDSQGRTSTGGVPLYTTTLSFSYEGSMDTTLELINYLEQGSKGCYFINTLTMNPIESSSNYSVNFSVTLYYFDSTKTVETTAATEATEE